MTKKIIALVLTLLCCMGLFACRDPFDDTDEGSEGKIIIQVGILPDDNERTLMQALKESYEETHSDIYIKIVEYPETTFINSMATYIQLPDKMPDVMWVPSDQYPAFAKAGHFVDLREEFEAVGLDQYYPAMIEQTHYDADDQGIWYAPRDYNKPVLFCNMDIFEAAEIDLPEMDENWTWEAFRELCEELRQAMNTNRDPEKAAVGLQKSSYPVDADLVWNPSYLSVLAELSGGDSLIKGTEFNLDSEANMEAYKALYRDFIAPKLFTNPQTDNSDMFKQHMAAMWISVRPKLPETVKVIPNIDFLPLPTSRIASGCSGYAVTKVSENRVSTEAGNTKSNAEHAKDFVMWISSEEGQKVAGETGAGIPVIKDLVNDESWRGYLSKDLNHEAFVANAENDLAVNIFKEFDPKYQYNLFSNLNALLVEVGNENNWKNSPIMDPDATGYEDIERAVAGVIQKLEWALNG